MQHKRYARQGGAGTLAVLLSLLFTLPALSFAPSVGRASPGKFIVSFQVDT